jgi:predicted O-methyltransferase YrrM
MRRGRFWIVQLSGSGLIAFSSWGTYCGYSALRTARVMPTDAHLYSVEFNPANAEIARRIFAHAGIEDRVTVVVGTLGDDGQTLRTLRDEFAFTEGSLDLAFFDHDKDAYLSDLQLVLDEGWLHPGSVVVADNILVPERRDLSGRGEGGGVVALGAAIRR